MKKPKNPEITRKNLYNPEVSMPYWVEYSSGEFIREIVRSMREELSVISTLVNFIHENPGADTTPVLRLNREKTVKEVCDMIAMRETKFGDMLDVAWNYAEHIEPQDSK